jgi:hypothetical protein
MEKIQAEDLNSLADRILAKIEALKALSAKQVFAFQSVPVYN